MGADDLLGFNVGQFEAFQHPRLAEQRKNHHHVAAGAQPGRRSFDLHRETGLTQHTLGPDHLAGVGEDQQAPVIEAMSGVGVIFAGLPGAPGAPQAAAQPDEP